MNREEKTEKHMKADFKLPLGIIKLFLAGGRVLELLKKNQKGSLLFFSFLILQVKGQHRKHCSIPTKHHDDDPVTLFVTLETAVATVPAAADAAVIPALI